MPQGKFFHFKSLWQGSTLQLLAIIILPLALLVLVFALGSTWLQSVQYLSKIWSVIQLSMCCPLNEKPEFSLSTERMLSLTATSSHWAKSAPDEASQKSLQELGTIAEQTIENLRRTTRALRPVYLEDLGLVTALEMLARETESASNIKVVFQKQGNEKRLAAPVELALYRMAQEALNNVVRHAQATHAELSIQFGSDKIEVQIYDNGIGFETPITPADFAPSGHFGLLGMYERADLTGARLTIRSTPGEGIRLKIQLSQTA